MINSTRLWLVSRLPGDDLVSFQRYVLVGVLQNGAVYGAMLLLLWCGLSAWQATIVLYPMAVLVSFLVNRRWSFGGRKMNRWQLHKYILVYVVTYFATILLNWSQETEGVPSWLASLVTMAIAVGALFAVLNFWVFRQDKDSGKNYSGAA